MRSTLPGWVAHWASRRPDRTVIHFDGTTWSWSGLHAAMTEWSGRLAAAGVSAGDRVAILMLNRPEFLVVEWACHRLGAIAMPVNTRLAAPELADVLADATPAAVVYEDVHALSALTELVTTGWPGPAIDVDAPAIEPIEPIEVTRPPRTVDEPAALLYTSGTTGRPKGVTLTLGNLEASAHLWTTEFALDHRDVHLVCMPLCFAGGFVASSKHPLAAGGTIVLLREFTPEKALRLIERHRVTWITAVPLMLQRMWESPDWAGTDLSSLRGIQSGGAVVPAPMIEAYAQRGIGLSQAYGLTEGSAGPSLWLDEAFTAAKMGSVGQPGLGTEVRVLDQAGNDVPRGEVGELALRGPLIFAGYWRQPELTANSFADGWFRTGDLVREDDDGFYFIAGRGKEMIVSGGLNVYPAEVEIVLKQCPGLLDAAVVGVPSQTWGEAVAACVIPEPGAKLTEREVIEFCRTRLADYKAPKEVHFFDDLPRTLSSKVQRVALRDQLRRRRATPE
ncbi:class I adenylate-forming enzyme family protein [Actinomadura sp. 1N219]|uniref:class I adenylate-forming enzyme family protein n=1 Tax=Actinomadura sp. 1N219 TaxID=3375152 RepID=UPI0037A54D6D